MNERLREMGFEPVDKPPSEKERPRQDQGDSETDEQQATWEPVEGPPQQEPEPGPADKLIQAFNQAEGKDKDRVARTYKAANKTGKNPAVVEVDLERAERAAQRPDFEKMAGEAPTLTKANKSAFFANQAGDDTDNLTTLEKIGKQYQRSHRQIVRRGELGYRELTQGETEETQEALERLRGQKKKPVEAQSWWESFALSATRMAPYLWESVKESQKYGVGGATIGAAASAPVPVMAPVTSAAGYTIGTTYGAFKKVYELESGLAHTEMVEAGVDRDISEWISPGVGVFAGALELLQISDVVRTIPGAKNAIRRGLMQAAKNVAKKQGIRKEMSKAASRGSQFLTREVVQEIAQESTQVAGQELGKSWTNELKGTSLDHITPEQYTRQMLAVAEESAKAFTVFGLPGASMQIAGIAGSMRQEAKTEHKLEQIAKVAGKSKLYQRNPDLFKDFVTDLQQQYGHVPRKLYLDSGTVQQIFQEDPEMAETLGYDRDDLDKKLADDEDVRIGFETAIDLYQRSDWDTIKEGMREAPFAPEDVDQATLQRVTELFQETQDLTAPAQRFRDRVLETTQLDREQFKQQYGVAPETFAQDQAKVIDSFAKVWAENTGRTPEQYWEYRGFDIRTEEGGREAPAYGSMGIGTASEVEVSYEIPEAGAGHGEAQSETGLPSEAALRERRGKGTAQGQQRLPLEYYSPTEEGPPSDQVVQKIIQSGEVEQITTGQFEVNVDAVTSPEEAAAVVKPLGSKAQEHTVAIVMDAQQRPISIIKHSIGNKDNVQAHAATLAAAIHNTPDADSVYIAHNHPSSNTDLSSADFQMAKAANQLLEGTGIEMRGELVVTPTGRASFYGPAADVSLEDVTPREQADLKRRIDIKEREFTKVPENPFVIRGPESLKDFFDTYLKGQQGVLLMNNNMSPVGFVPMTPEEMGKLRMGRTGEGASKLWQGIDRTNGTIIALNLGEQSLEGPNIAAVDNMLRWARDSQVNVADVLHSEGSSMKEEGELKRYNERLKSEGTFFQDRKASVTFEESGQAIINLFRNNDLSSILHETGHIFRRDLEEMANLPGVSQQVRDDWNTILEWVGAEDGNWTREQEEKFAQAWEEYFREASAPTPRLKRAFSRFRKWLLDIYEGSRRSFELTDDVRAVFDRMVATRDELDHALEQMMLDPALEQEDMTLEEWQEYQRLAADAQREAMEQATKERLANWRTLQKEWRKQAREMAEEHPIVQIRKELRQGGGLNLGMLRNDYDQETIREINRRSPGVLKENGDNIPDSTAEAYGYEYDDFIMALVNTPTKADLEEQFFKQLEAEYDKNWRPDEALLSDEQFKLLDKEIEILNKKLERFNPPASRSLARHVRKQVQQGRYQDIEADLDTLLGTLHREGKESKQAIREARREGKREAWERALEQKRKQRLQAIKLREQRKAKKRVDTIRRKLRRWLKQKNLDPDYKEQLRQFLAPFDLAQRTDKALAERQSLRQFIQDHKDAGEQVLDIPPALEDLASRKHLKELSLAELEEIHDTAQHIVHLGRLKQKLVSAQKARDFAEVRDTLVQTARAEHKVKEKPEGVPPPSARKQGAVDTMIESGHGWMADLRKIEFILQSLDGSYGDEMQQGPWWNSIFKPIQDAEHEEIEVLREVMGQLDEAFKTIREQGNKVFQQKHRIEGWPHPMTREEMIMIALNWGNEGNRDAVRWGYGLMDTQMFRQNPEMARLQADTKVGNVLNSLTKQEWQFVSNVWDIIDSLYPRINEAHKALTGQALDRVEPSPVDTPIGRLRGGYFPLMFDRELSYKADVYKTEQEGQLLFETIHSRPKTESGHRIARQGGKLPPYLSFNVITDHLQKAIHDATHAVPVRDVYKLLKDSEVRQSIIDTQGKSTYDQLVPWLQYVANPIRPQTTKQEKFLRHMRNNTTIALLGWNVGTMMAQPMSITQAVDAVGVAPISRSMMSFWTNPFSFVETVHEKSTQMSNRKKTWNREFADVFNQWVPTSGRGKRAMREAQKLAMFTISLGDYVGAYPAWMGAYKKAMKEGSTEAEAIEYADRIVRTTQPASSPKDLPAVQQLNKGEGTKLISMFYSFFNVFYNRLYNKHQGKLQGQVSAGQLARSYIWMVAVPPIMLQVFKHRGDLDEEYWREQYWKDLLGYVSGTLPIVRDLVNSFVTGFDFQLTPVSEAFKTGVDLSRELFSDEPQMGNIAEYTMETVGYATGLPTPAAIDMAKGLADVVSGRTEDYLRPLYGKKREDWQE